MVKNMRKYNALLILLFLSLFMGENVYAEDYFVTDPVDSYISKDARQALKKKGYKPIGGLLTNGYVRVKKKKSYSLSDAQGNMLKSKYGFVTDMFKGGTFVSATPDIGVGDYGEAEVEKYINLVLRNADGSVLKDIGAQNADYHLAAHQIHIYKVYNTSSASYFTFHRNADVRVPQGNSSYMRKESREGLMDGQGRVVLQPDYASIEHVYGTYFKVKKTYKNNSIKIVDVATMNEIPVTFEGLQISSPNGVYGNTLVFNGNIVAKTNGKYGIYNLPGRKWHLPNIYDKIKLIHDHKKVGRKDRQGLDALSNIIYTNKFVVKKSGKWGVVNANGQTIVPISYASVSRSFYGTDMFAITNANGKKNFYDTLKRKEHFPNFYDSISMDGSRKNTIIVKDNGRLGIISLNPFVELVPFSAGYSDFVFRRQHKALILKNTQRQHSIYSIEQKKVIWKHAKSINGVGGLPGFFVVANFSREKGIVDSSGNIILPFGRYTGAVKARGDNFMFYSVHKPSKVLQCVARSGKVLSKNDCK